MTEQPPRGDSAPDESGAGTPPAESASVTESGYDYTVVDDADALAKAHPGGGAPSPMLLAALAIVPAIVVGALVWLVVAVVMGGGGGASRAQRDVGNVLNVFSQGQSGAVVTRYEGTLAPGFPADIPTYPGSKIIASVVQVADGDANYLVVYDTSASRSDVGEFLAGAFAEDPWQLDAGQNGDASTLHRFSKIDDPDVTGIALSAESDGDSLTTIVLSVQVVSGGKAAKNNDEFAPGDTKALPEGFPPEVEAYPDGIVIEATFQKQAAANTYSISVLTKDSVSDVLDFYRTAFGGSNWTVADQDASQAPLQNAEGLSFSSDDPAIAGNVIAGDFAHDGDYTQIDVQVALKK